MTALTTEKPTQPTSSSSSSSAMPTQGPTLETAARQALSLLERNQALAAPSHTINECAMAELRAGLDAHAGSAVGRAMNKERIGYALGLLMDMGEWENWDNERWVGEWGREGQLLHPIDLLSEIHLTLVRTLCTCGKGAHGPGKHAPGCVLSGIGHGRGES